MTGYAVFANGSPFQVLSFHPGYAGQIIEAHSRFQEIVEEAVDE